MASFFPVPYEQKRYVRSHVLDAVSESRTLPTDVKRKPYVTGGESFGANGSAVFVAPGRPGRRDRVETLPPHLYRPVDAFPLDLPLSRLPFAIGAGGSAVLALWPAIPQGQRGVVEKIGIVVTAGALADCRSVTRINGAPCQPYPGVVGAVGTLEVPQTAFIMLAAGDIFDLLVTSTGAGITVAVRTVGWLYTEEKA